MSGSKEKDGRKIFTWKSSSTMRFLDLSVIRSFLRSSPPEWCLSCLYFILLVLLLWEDSPTLIKNKIRLKFMQGNMFCICYSIRVATQIQNCRRIPYQESCSWWIGNCTSSDTRTTAFVFYRPKEASAGCDHRLSATSTCQSREDT